MGPGSNEYLFPVLLSPFKTMPSSYRFLRPHLHAPESQGEVWDLKGGFDVMPAYLCICYISGRFAKPCLNV